MFHVGQKVVCVNDIVGAFNMPGTISISGLDGLTKGAVYTVRGIVSDPVQGGELCLYLAEIHRRVCPIAGIEAPFASGRFRPVAKRKTNISIFTAMLNPSKVDA